MNVHSCDSAVRTAGSWEYMAIPSQTKTEQLDIGSSVLTESSFLVPELRAAEVVRLLMRHGTGVVPLRSSTAGALRMENPWSKP